MLFRSSNGDNLFGVDLSINIQLGQITKHLPLVSNICKQGVAIVRDIEYNVNM